MKRFSEFVNEKELLLEMATLRPRKSNLPVALHIDDSSVYLGSGHGPRVKFELVKTSTLDTRDKSTMCTMDFDGNLHYGAHIPKFSDRISEKEIDQIRNFVRNNRRLLRLVADGFIDYDDAVSIMIMGGKSASSEELFEQRTKIESLLVKNGGIPDRANLGKMQDMELFILTEDPASEPCVHISSNGKEYVISLLAPKYIDGSETLSSSEKYKFNNFMNENSKIKNSFTNYELAVSLWNDNNTNRDVEIEYYDDGRVIIPDYSTLH